MVAVNLDTMIPTVQDQQLPLWGEGNAHRTGEPLSNKDTVAPTLGEVDTSSVFKIVTDHFFLMGKSLMHLNGLSSEEVKILPFQFISMR